MVPKRLKVANILCPTDFSSFSEHALERAAGLSSWFDARLTLVHVVTPIATMIPTDAGIPFVAAPIDILKIQQKEAAGDLDRLTAPLRARGLQVEARVLVGDPSREIETAAEAIPADLIVMGTHGRGGFEHLVMGSVAERTLRRAPCPVLVVGNDVEPLGRNPRFRRILCAVDLTDASARTVDMALSFAGENQAKLTVFHVVESLVGEGNAILGIPEPDVAALGRSLVERSADSLRRLVPPDARAFCEVTERVEVGKAWRTILRAGQEGACDLIVLGAHSSGSLGRFFLGSTANQVVRHAHCPVLVIREARVREGLVVRPSAWHQAAAVAR